MPLTRPRFTVRRLMVAVAVAGCLSGAEVTRRRRDNLRSRAECHKLAIERAELEFAPQTQKEWVTNSGRSYPSGRHAPTDDDPPHIADWRRSQARRVAFHEIMHRECERAARYPWLPVPPDPAEPE